MKRNTQKMDKETITTTTKKKKKEKNFLSFRYHFLQTQTIPISRHDISNFCSKNKLKKKKKKHHINKKKLKKTIGK